MVPGHPTGNDRVQGLNVSRDPCCDAGKVGSTRGAQDTHVLSLGGEGKGCSVHGDGVHIQPVLSRVVALGMVEKELGLLWDINHAPGGGE